MEKRIIAVIKWLERSLKSCRDGQVESAMMDVECARADMERLRSEVWADISRRYERKKSRPRALVCFLGVLFVLALCEPLRPDSGGFARVKRDSLEITRTVTLQGQDDDEPKSAQKSKPQGAARTSKPKPAPDPTQKAAEGEISFERVASLLQTGEKALKNGSPIIKIEKITQEK
ncbi:hypothetical protein AGMMS50276_13410 [Synergistales bacterium]|nr:hypothetical protein AGMMS50276_13410 [Synergistales bacterium]